MAEPDNQADIERDGNHDDGPQQLIIPDDEDDAMITLFPNMLDDELSSEVPEKKYSILFDDIFYRAPELENLCLWDILRSYVKEKKPKSKVQRNTYLDFKTGHPQQTTHCLKKLDNPVIPVLMGYRIPRDNAESDKPKYCVIILTLFQPWSTVKLSPLKPLDLSWSDAFETLRQSMPPEHNNFSAKRGKRLAELMRKAKDSGREVEDNVEDVYDPVWENAMQAAIDPDDFDDSVIVRNTRSTRDAENIVNDARTSGFYSVIGSPSSELQARFEEGYELEMKRTW
ncbi:hypothetical protein B0H12DRAFT_1075797 [Mycena haematopus]|nr:hypothetical protein B0H12DRAFT_1075797 [Mycena haematopus]